MMNNEPPTREMCLCIAEIMFDESFIKKSDQKGWQYLFMWAMYDHWIEQYWNEP